MESTGEVVKTNPGSDGVKSNSPPDFNVAPRSETLQPPPNAVAPPPPPPTTEGFSSGLMKKKRGRPKKYSHDGATVALSPTPISTAAPTTSHVIDFSSSEKRDKVKPLTSSSFFGTKYDQVEILGGHTYSSTGANFTPHILTVKAGEDITKSIISFSQRESFAICVLCANGVVSSVTLRQLDSSGGTLTYEGRFEILTLSGSFMPCDSDGTRNRSGGMNVSLASPDGHVVGGSVAGLLVAATPIQVVIGSFVAGTNHQDHNLKKSNHNSNANVNDDHRTIQPTPSTLPISTWSPPFPSDPRHKPSHDINITLT